MYFARFLSRLFLRLTFLFLLLCLALDVVSALAGDAVLGETMRAIYAFAPFCAVRGAMAIGDNPTAPFALWLLFSYLLSITGLFFFKRPRWLFRCLILLPLIASVSLALAAPILRVILSPADVLTVLGAFAWEKLLPEALILLLTMIASRLQNPRFPGARGL